MEIASTKHMWLLRARDLSRLAQAALSTWFSYKGFGAIKQMRQQQ